MAESLLPNRAEALSTRQRLPGLDVFRALAVVMVASVHFALLTTQLFDGKLPHFFELGGILGVELFFVLSGFLIGGLLLDIVERQPDRRAWARFMVRRWMRTLPLYFFWICVLLVIAPPHRHVVSHVISYMTFTQNLAGPMPKDNWFGVSWSLSVEEWFYLIFSALCLALAAYRPRSAIAIACTVFLVVPLAARLGFAPQHGNLDRLVRKVVIFRLDAIAYGVAMIFLWRARRDLLLRFRGQLFAAGGLILGFSAWLVSTPLFGGLSEAILFTVVPAGLALLFPLVAGAQSVPFYKGVRWLSERSYAIYIVHLDLTLLLYRIVADSDAFPRLLYLPLVVVVTLVVADLCYRFVEQPPMRRRPAQFAAGLAPPSGPTVAPAVIGGASVIPATTPKEL